jgi:hypothetical protein
MATASIDSVLIGGDLSRGVNLQRLISLLDTDGVEESDPVQPNNVLEVPADKHIHAGYRRRRDVKHIIAILESEDSSLSVYLQQ